MIISCLSNLLDWTALSPTPRAMLPSLIQDLEVDLHQDDVHENQQDQVDNRLAPLTVMCLSPL